MLVTIAIVSYTQRHKSANWAFDRQNMVVDLCVASDKKSDDECTIVYTFWKCIMARLHSNK